VNTNAPARRTLSSDELRQLVAHTGIDETLSTREAAALLGRKPQTLRRWSCDNSGPIHPMRAGSVLRWKVADIRAVLGGQTVTA
jgi:hypothetical protein